MLRLLLALVLLALIGLMVAGRLGEWRRSQALGAPGTDSSPVPEELPVRSGGIAHLLDSITRLSARMQLNADPERQYLDSLLQVTDSTIRHWPITDTPLWYALVSGGTPDWSREMLAEARTAIDAWSPSSLGLRLIETDDTSRAALMVNWATALPGRAGVTNVTWDPAGMILRARVTLATRDPQAGQPLKAEARRAIALHELGHAFGLPHSADPGDAMYPVTDAERPSDRDMTSLRLLYSLPAGWIGGGNGPNGKP